MGRMIFRFLLAASASTQSREAKTSSLYTPAKTCSQYTFPELLVRSCPLTLQGNSMQLSAGSIFSKRQAPTWCDLKDLCGICNDLAKRAVRESTPKREAPCAADAPPGLHHGIHASLNLGTCILIARLVHEVPGVHAHIGRPEAQHRLANQREQSRN